MINIKFNFVSANDQFKAPPETTDQITKQHANIRFEYIRNNTDHIAVVYNKILSRDMDQYDYVAMVHADVEFDFVEFTQQLDKIKDRYDVIGLCGCSKISVSQSPLNWYCGSIPFPDSRWGCVTHGELNNQCSFFSQHSPDVTDHEVACIDGLCIVFSKRAAGLRFDATLGKYSHYDTDISFQAVLNHKLKLGVLVRKELKHYSVGKSILQQQFLLDEITFREKWKLGFPPGSLIEKYANERAYSHD